MSKPCQKKVLRNDIDQAVTRLFDVFRNELPHGTVHVAVNLRTLDVIADRSETELQRRISYLGWAGPVWSYRIDCNGRYDDRIEGIVEEILSA